jgi:hypothetical protein
MSPRDSPTPETQSSPQKASEVRVHRTALFAFVVLLITIAIAFTGPFFVGGDSHSETDFRTAIALPNRAKPPEASRPRARACDPRTGACGRGAGGAGSTRTCEECETARCSVPRSSCDNASEKVNGVLQSELCHQVLGCIRKSGCAAATGNVSDCICGEGIGLTACANQTLEQATGACKDIIATASESTSLSVIATRFADPTCATGLAFQLVQCNQSQCARACGFGASDATNEDSAATDDLERKCAACQAAQPICNARKLACDNAAGDIHGIPKSELCREVIDCIRDSGCASADGSASDCICGENVDVGECQGKSLSELTGRCKDVISAGLGTTDLGEIAVRFGDPEYATGLAVQLIQCEQTFCEGSCEF